MNSIFIFQTIASFPRIFQKLFYVDYVTNNAYFHSVYLDSRYFYDFFLC